MANLAETSDYSAGVYQIETNDQVLAGPDGVANLPHRQLASRTKYLRAAILSLTKSVEDAASQADLDALTRRIEGTIMVDGASGLGSDLTLTANYQDIGSVRITPTSVTAKLMVHCAIFWVQSAGGFTTFEWKLTHAGGDITPATRIGQEGDNVNEPKFTMAIYAPGSVAEQTIRLQARLRVGSSGKIEKGSGLYVRVV